MVHILIIVSSQLHQSMHEVMVWILPWQSLSPNMDSKLYHIICTEPCSQCCLWQGSSAKSQPSVAVKTLSVGRYTSTLWDWGLYTTWWQYGMKSLHWNALWSSGEIIQFQYCFLLYYNYAACMKWECLLHHATETDTCLFHQTEIWLLLVVGHFTTNYNKGFSLPTKLLV